MLWEALSSDWEPGYSAPFLIDAAGVPQLIIWHPRAISSLDPATGAVHWEVPHVVDMGMSVPTPVRSGPWLFVTFAVGRGADAAAGGDASGRDARLAGRWRERPRSTDETSTRSTP